MKERQGSKGTFPSFPISPSLPSLAAPPPQNRQLYVRERSDGLYRPATYLAFKMIDELALNWAVGVGCAACIFYGVRLSGSFLYFWLLYMTTLSNAVGE